MVVVHVSCWHVRACAQADTSGSYSGRINGPISKGRDAMFMFKALQACNV